MPSSKKALFDAASVCAIKMRAKGKTVDEAAFAELVKMEPDIGHLPMPFTPDECDFGRIHLIQDKRRALPRPSIESPTTRR